MPKAATTVGQLLRPQARFMRSVHLERDFQDDYALSGYILTDHAADALTRIGSGLRPTSGQRAWRITGNYGAGKSSFALVLAHWFAGQARILPPPVRRRVAYKDIAGKTPHALPVLVTGSREPLSRSIARAILSAYTTFNTIGRRPAFLATLTAFAEAQPGLQPPDEDLIQALEAASKHLVETGKASGLLLILDELGKFLEYATLHPERQDIYLLQRLAESACRSKATPFYVVALLHQGFHEYAHTLSEVAQREWEKVAARFEEILFDQPLEQLASLIGAALNIRVDRLPLQIRQEAASAFKLAVKTNWFGSAFQVAKAADSASSTFPLHPSVLPVLARFFKRFGQNERSLFSFLLSNEPFGLRAFSERSLKGDSFFRLHHLYDYVRCNFGQRLALHSYRSHWNHIDSMIQSYVPSAPAELDILKTIGILNLLDTDDLRPTKDVVLLAVGSIADGIKKNTSWSRTLTTLSTRKGVLYDRGRAGGYCLWPYTSVNLELAYERAVEAIPATLRVSSRIENYVETRPVVARRHYITKGNLRYFEVKYCPIAELPNIPSQFNPEGNGLIVVPLCETEAERQQAMAFARHSVTKSSTGLIVAVPPPLNNLGGVIAEAERWEWVSRNTAELENDRYAGEEVSRQRKAAQNTLDNRLAAFVGLHHFSDETSLQCYHAGKKLDVRSGRDLLKTLSTICDDLYCKAPVIKNEMVNRQFLSSAAAAARMRLIKRILEYASEPLLGMDPEKKPPEMSMYLSVLRSANIHRPNGDGWTIGVPDDKNDPCFVRPIWGCIDAVLQDESDARVKVSTIATALRRPPYGLRDGLFPILLAAYIVANRDKVAVYEDGSFRPMLHGEDFQRLTKAPESFEIQYCQADGVRSEVLEKVWQLVSDDNLRARKLAILDVVRPICVFIASLPEYTRHTKNLSNTALAVRHVVLAAHDPARLLFRELPKACDCAAVKSTELKPSAKQNTGQFITRLGAALSELRMAYPQLTDRIRQQLRTVFDLSTDPDVARHRITERAAAVLANVAEPRLKAFCIRLSDDDHTDAQWIESIGSFLASRPPSKWTDTDEGHFLHELAIHGARFARVEGMFFDKRIGSGTPTGVRVTLTKADGCERDRVIHADQAQERDIAATEAKILKLVSAKGPVGIAAASRALWKALSDAGDNHE